jgi:diacylglycerol O-acyltransferase
MERMTTLDAEFFFVEHENVPMHLGSLAVFEGPAPSYDDVIKLLAAKLPLVPRYRQIVRPMPLQLFRPVWADDEQFELGYHVRHAAVPSPGSDEQLRNLGARVLAQRLDRARPLWEAWLLEGIKGGRWAILSKVHHAMVDGVGGNDLMTALFDLSADADPPVPVEWEPEPEPDVMRLLADGVSDTVAWSLRQLGSAPGFLRPWLRTPGELLDFGRGLTGSARRLAVPSAQSLNGPIGPHRRWAWTTASLDEVKKIRHDRGGTVNDVLLAAVTRGFRDLLEARGELVDGLVVRTLVPVSVRRKDDAGGTITNRVSAVLANLPVGEPDPLRRLALLRGQMDNLKQTDQAVSAQVITQMLGFASPTLLALGARAAFRLPQPLVQTVTTNVPGPPVPLFVLGRQMVEVYPYVPIGNSMRIGVAIFSYLGRLSFGITGDYNSTPDLDVLTEGIKRGLAELQTKPPRKRAAPPKRDAAPAKRRAAPRKRGAAPAP